MEVREMLGESLMIEVSRSGASTDEARDALLAQIATPLLAAKVKPVIEGKTLVASDCP